MRGSDLIAPQTTMTLNGRKYQLVFNNDAYRVIEDVYFDIYQLPPKKCDILSILQEMANKRYRAIEAVYYGAFRAGGGDLSWEAFDKVFSLDAIDQVRRILTELVEKSLPEPDPNAQSQLQAETITDGHGAG